MQALSGYKQEYRPEYHSDTHSEYPLIHPLRGFSYGPAARHMVKGEGIYVQDEDGRTYIDGISGLWNVSLGYGNKGILDAIQTQLENIPFVNLFENNNPTTLAFAEKLLEITSYRFHKVLYTCTGSEAVEAAIKTARKYHSLKGKSEKKRIAVLDLAYHGTTYGAMSVSGMDRELTDGYDPMLAGVDFLPSPVCGCCLSGEMSEGCLSASIDALETALAQKGHNTAALMLEPVIGSGGIYPVPPEYMIRAKELCREHDILFILDEVATGFGRTGKMFAYEHYNGICIDYDAAPDLMCLSKGINSGYIPMGALLLNKKVAQVFESSGGHIEHLSTQNGNPAACAAGLATLHELEDKGLIRNVERQGAVLLQELRESIGQHKNVYEVRGKGLMIGVGLVSGRARAEGISFDELMRLVSRIKQKGLLVYPFYKEPFVSGFSLFPPFIIEENEIRRIVKIIQGVMERTIC